MALDLVSQTRSHGTSGEDPFPGPSLLHLSPVGFVRAGVAVRWIRAGSAAALLGAFTIQEGSPLLPPGGSSEILVVPEPGVN